MGQFKRRHYIVEMDFQSRFIVRFVSAMVLGMAASIVLFNHIAMRELESLKWRMVIFEGSLAEIMMPYMFYITIFAVIFTAFLLGVVSNYLHRDIVGVIYRLKRDMEDVANGNLRIRIGLRKTDPFKEAARELDKVVASARRRFRRTNIVFRETKQIIDSIGEVREEFLADKCHRLYENVRELEESMKK
jgi:methyl-accepting chemotaxis protein